MMPVRADFPEDARGLLNDGALNDADNVSTAADALQGSGGPASSAVSLPLRQSVYHSQALGRSQPYAYYAPPGFEPDDAVNSDTRFPLLILLHGLRGDHLTWPTQTRLGQYARAYNLFIAFPEGGEGWYTNAYDSAARYEDDLMGDFLPHLQDTLPLLPSGKNWAIGGMSMGGHGAIKIALKYGRMFSLALAHSGAFEYPQQQPLHPVFGDPQADLAARRAVNVFKLAEDALSTWPPARPNLYLDCGTEDRLLESNRRFHQHLDFIGYRHTYSERPGYHNLPYWDRAIRQALPIVAEAVSGL